MQDELVQIPARIKELRENCRLSQADIAHRLGISRTSVSAWEMGSVCPNAAYLVELSKLFCVPVDFILGIESNMTVKLDSLSNDEREIIFSLMRLFAAQRK